MDLNTLLKGELIEITVTMSDGILDWVHPFMMGAENSDSVYGFPAGSILLRVTMLDIDDETCNISLLAYHRHDRSETFPVPVSQLGEFSSYPMKPFIDYLIENDLTKRN